MPYSVIETIGAGLPVMANDIGDLRLMLAPDVAGECTVLCESEAGFA